MKKLKLFLGILIPCLFLGLVFSGCNKDPQCYQLGAEIVEAPGLTQAQIDLINESISSQGYTFEATRSAAKDEFDSWVSETEKELNALILFLPSEISFQLFLKECESGKVIKKKTVTVDPNA